jgi:serine protease inhibitor
MTRLFLLSLVCAGAAWGQAPTGSIVGTVFDSLSQQGVRDAVVAIVGTARKARTDTVGRYQFDSVQAGTVRVRVYRIGYRTAMRDSLVVVSGQTTEANFRMPRAVMEVLPVAPTPEQVRNMADSGASGAYASADSAGGATYIGFSLRLFRQVARQAPDANIFLSPASAAWALAMTAEGAAGGTWERMAHTLGVDAHKPKALGPANATVLASLGAQSGLELNIANSIWASEGRPFLPTFLDGTRRWYGAQVTSMRLSGPAAEARINGWVSDATHGLIPTVLSDTLPESMAMVLINAVYFHGKWRSVFDSVQTKPQPFKLVNGDTVPRPLMTQRQRFLYLRDSGFQALRLPYMGGRLAMYVFLPDSGQRLSAFVSQLDSAHWVRWMHGFRDVGDVVTKVPKFRLTYGTSLSPTLKQLGMAVAFDAQGADFSRMMPKAFLQDTNAYITDVLQKTFVEVNEQGTKAAAVTAADMRLLSVTVVHYPEFIVDRPFCVAIRDDQTGAILFLGQITDPGAAH